MRVLALFPTSTASLGTPALVTNVRHVRGTQYAMIAANFGLGATADVIRAETELFHLEIFDQSGEVLPRSNKRVTEQCSLHQPHGKWQNKFSEEACWYLCIHNDKTAAGTKLILGST